MERSLTFPPFASIEAGRPQGGHPNGVPSPCAGLGRRKPSPPTTEAEEPFFWPGRRAG